MGSAKHKWEDMFADLVAYRPYGDCNVPADWSENPRLAWWVRYQRRYRSRLSARPPGRLDQIGFTWTRAKEAWESHYAALVEYQRAHGHCRVPTQSKDHARLGNWVRMMRTYRKLDKLSEERIRRLTQLGFAWDLSNRPTLDGDK